jgi:peptide/nickel transport system ATP-binding protein
LVMAVAESTFTIAKGEVFGLIGESGCGKSTTARLLTGLEAPSNGTVHFDGALASSTGKAPERHVRRQMGMIFQDPYDSLNPGMRIVDVVGEPLMVHEPGLSVAERREKVLIALEAADLRPAEDYADRFPHQLSGGQRQRVAIARAMVLEPRFIAADEPTSMLDVSVRAGILNSMLKLRAEMGLTYLFITHDLTVARYMCDRIGVMYNGRIVESGPTDEIIQHSAHPYTQALIQVVANLSGFLDNRTQFIKNGEAGALVPGFTGCPFTARCPKATSLCSEQMPKWEEVGNGHFTACHYT